MIERNDEAPSDEGLTPHAIVLEYDGRPFFGWQRHGEQPTVQLALETAITRAFGLRVAVAGSGRTDRGAHARGQVASVLLPVGLDCVAAVVSLNNALPETVRVRRIQPVSSEFNVRDDALSKVYHYIIWNHPELPPAKAGRVWHIPGRLNVEAMQEACAVIVGAHDFTSFATRPNFKQKNTRRTVTRASFELDAPQLTFTIEADGFLYKMVRNIVRALVKVGEGRQSAEDLTGILAACDRKAAVGTAPASGLYLHEVIYPDGALVAAPAS